VEPNAVSWWNAPSLPIEVIYLYSNIYLNS
jgi:hypothetical protein